jgi:hypothetical protein
MGLPDTLRLLCPPKNRSVWLGNGLRLAFFEDKQGTVNPLALSIDAVRELSAGSVRGMLLELARRIGQLGELSSGHFAPFFSSLLQSQQIITKNPSLFSQ